MEASSGRTDSARGPKIGVLTDSAEPVGRIARVGFAAMGDPMPESRYGTLAQVVGLLRRLVTRLPEVVDLKQSRHQGQAGRPWGGGEEYLPGGVGQDLLEPGPWRGGLNQSDPLTVVVSERGVPQSRDQLGRCQVERVEHALRRFTRLESFQDQIDRDSRGASWAEPPAGSRQVPRHRSFPTPLSRIPEGSAVENHQKNLRMS